MSDLERAAYPEALARGDAVKLWYVLKTKRPEVMPRGIRRSEEVAVSHLTAQGHEIYLPYCKREDSRHWEIMFPGYVFIAEPEGATLPWISIKATRGVAYVLDRAGGREGPPQGFTEALVDELRAREQGGVVVIQKPPLPYSSARIGHRFTILDGPFESHTGKLDRIFEAADGEVRVVLLLELLGNSLTVPFDPVSVRPCNPI